MLNLILGGAGTGKSYLMMDRIKTAVHQKKNITVIIPDQFSFEFDRTLYRHLGISDFNKVTVLSFSRLAKHIFITHGGVKGQYANDIVKTALMYITLKNISEKDGLYFYKRQAKSPAFSESCLEFVKDMSLNAITADALSDVADRLSDNIKDKVTDMALIYSEFTRLMSEKGYKDSLTDITESAEKASLSGHFIGQYVFIDAFKSFTADEIMLIEVILSQAENVDIALTTENTTPCEYTVFDTPDHTHRILSAICREHNIKINTVMLDKPQRFRSEALLHISENIMRTNKEVYSYNTEDIKITEANDIYKEADVVCSQIRHLIMEKGYHFNDIAVVSRNPDDYCAILQASFEKYDIAYYEDRKESVIHKSLVVFISTALDIISSEHINTEDVLRYIKTDLSGLSAEEVSIIEDYCYQWNVEGDMWKEEFIADTDGICEQLRKRIIIPLAELKESCTDCDGSSICKNIYCFFDRINLQGRIKDITDSYNGDDSAVLTAIRELRQLWDMLCSTFESLYTVLEGQKIPLAEFNDLFSTVMRSMQISMPPQTLDCVTVASANTSRLAEPKVVFVLGANEGVFPATLKTTGIFSEKDRELLLNAGIKLNGGIKEKIAEERFVAYNTLSSASEKLFISYPLSDASGKGLYPSFLVSAINDMFSSDIMSTDKKNGLIYYCTTPQSAYYNYVEEYNKQDTESVSLRKALKKIPLYKAKTDYLDNLDISSMHTLDNGTGVRLFGKRISVSATGFENFNICPFKYFCQKGLNIYPKKRVEMNSPETGSVIHYCLSRLVENKSRDSFINLTADSMQKEIQQYLVEYYNKFLGGKYGKSKRFDTLYFNISSIVGEIAQHLQEEFSQSDFFPVCSEYKVSSATSIKSLDNQNSADIFFTGTIDRIDKAEIDGKKYLRVVDYKSGSKVFAFDDLLYGINMQMLLYLFAVISKNGDYSDFNPAGVLYMPATGTDPSLSRIVTQEDIDNLKNQTYKMKGVVLHNSMVIEAMEKNVSGIYIPVKKTKDAYSTFSKLITENQLSNLNKYCDELLFEMAAKLHQGQINAVPLVKKGRSPCSYCDYNSVCGNYPNVTIRPYAYDAEQKIMSILNREEE